MQVKDWHCCFTLIEYQHFKVKSRLKVQGVHFDRNFLRNIGIQILNLTFFFLNSRQTHSNLLHWSLHHCGQLQTGCPFSYKSWSPDVKRKKWIELMLPSAKYTTVDYIVWGQAPLSPKTADTSVTLGFSTCQCVSQPYSTSNLSSVGDEDLIKGLWKEIGVIINKRDLLHST